jgi:N-acetylneuraminate synthase
MGLGVAVASVAIGATVIEKHFTLARADGGIDSAFSSEPAEMSSLVLETERAWQSLGQVQYGPTIAEQKSLALRRSIYVTADIDIGEKFSESNIRIVRPGLGAPPSLYQDFLGRSARRSFRRGHPLSLDDLL